MFLYFSPRIIDDTILQTARVVSYQKGYGFTQAYSYCEDISKARHIPDTTFAPGVEYVLAALMSSFSMSFSIWLSSLAAISLVLFGSYLILNHYIPQSKPHQNWVFWCFFIFSPVMFLYCGLSDLFSLGFFLASVALTVSLINATASNASAEKKWMKYCTAAGIALTAYLSCFFRYAYYLFFWIPFFLLLIHSITTKNTWRYFLASFLIVTVLLFLQLINRSGSDYLENRHPDLLKTLYWKDLQQTTNFVADSYFDIGFAETVVAKLANQAIGYYSGIIIAVFTVLITLLILGFWIKRYKHLNKIHKKSEFLRAKTKGDLWGTDAAVDTFIALTIVTNVFSLVAFTVILGPSTTLVGWTYVEEKRYFAPFAVCLWLTLAKVHSLQPAKGFKWVLALGLVTIPLNVLQHVLKLKKQSNHSEAVEMYVMSQRLYTENKRANVFVTPHYSYRFADHAAMGGAFLCTLKLAENTRFVPSQPVDLYIPVPEKDIDRMEKQRLASLVSRFRAQPWMKISTFGVTTVYKATLEANINY
ncbi:MAG: hypothetical protein MUD08_05040 [Cytophagales bacterium]|nr:hypothetical protein [Cytophagales bacterium]